MEKSKKNNLFIIITSIAIIISLFGSLGFTQEKEVAKNETVYIVLNHDGSVKDERVVNWVYGKSDEKNWIDYGNYSDVANMTTEDKPIIEKDKIIWPMTLLESGSLYYQGVTDKELPVEINITYLLDGKEIKGEELAGKSGNLKIIFKVRNKLLSSQPVYYKDYNGLQKEYYEKYYTPFYVQILLKANLNLFSNIVAEDAAKVVSGEEMSISFGSYPYPEDEFTIEMQGEKIELDPISITVLPKEIPFPEIGDTKEKLIEMADGTSEMEDGAVDIINGLDRIISKSDELKSGSSDLIDAISKINHGAYSLNNNSGEIGSGFSELLSGTGTLKEESINLVNGLSEINENSSDIEKAIDDSASGLSAISSNTGMLSNGLTDILTNHNNLVSIAQGLVSSDPANETYQTLLAIAQGEQTGLENISSGMNDLNNGISQLSEGMDKLSNGYDSFGDGINQLTEGVAGLPDGIDQLYNGQNQLSDGWNKYSDAIAELYNGTQQLYDETRNFPEDINKLIDGIKKIRNGTNDLTNNGIVEMKNGVVENINDLKQGEALENKINELAKNYYSFMDNDRNKNSSVQFIMQTQEIKMINSVLGINEDNSGNNQNPSLWQRIINFFKKK
jgi:putative membrane protein